MIDIKEAISKIKSIDNLKTIIEYYGSTFKKDSEGYLTKCPIHGEKTPSFRLKDSDKGAIYHCFGCGAHGDIINFIENKESISNIEAIKKAYEILGLPLEFQPSKLDNFISFIKENNNEFKSNGKTFKYESTYTYHNSDNKPVYLKNKYRNTTDKSKKTFITKAIIETDKSYKYGDSEYFNNVEKVVYNLPRVKNAILKDRYIYFVEGEKDADNLNRLGFVATTIYSKKWDNNYSKQLQGSKIVFIGDTGKAGEEFKNLVWNNLKDTVKSFKAIDLPELEVLGDNADVTDWLESGHTKNDLLNVVERSLDLLDKNQLQQDFRGIYQTKFKKDKETEDIIEIKDYLTNFNIINAEIIRNEDNGDQVIKLKIKSNLGKVSEIEGNARECFADVKSFRKLLGIDYTFTKKTDELIKLQEWIIRYFIVKDTINYLVTGIREINGQNVLVTNKGTLYPDGVFDTTLKALNPFHDIDFEGIDILTPIEANKLAENLFSFNIKSNVYNTLGLGTAHILNAFARKSPKDNLPILQDIGESGSGKSIAFTILRLLYNNMATPMSYASMTDFGLQKALSDTYLPVFIDEVKPSKSSIHKLNVLSNNIRAVTEGYTNFKGTKSQHLNVYEIKASLILTGEEEIEETAVKNRSNIVWYARSYFTEEGLRATDFLTKTEEGKLLLRKLSKSIYLYILNNFNVEYLNDKYDIVKNKYYFESLIESPRETNTAVYTMLGLEILSEIFEELGVKTSKYINLKEASIDIAENIRNNVMEQGESGTKAEYEIVLEAIDHLAGAVDFDIQLIDGVDFKETTDGYIALRIPTIYDKLTKYYKTYKDEKLLGKNTFTKMLKKSKYVPADHYKKVQFKKVEMDKQGNRHTVWKPSWAYLLIPEELLKLDISNLIEREQENKEMEECTVIDFPF